MKTLYYSLLALFLTSCLPAQNHKQEIALDTGELILIGKITNNDLQNGTYADWYNAFYNDYQTDDEQIDQFKKKLNTHQILVFMGTWCGDSQREVPRFMKILEKVGYPKDKVKIIGLDKRDEFYKKSPGGEEEGFNIEYVPTFIFLKDGKEINRIVESPIYSLETDIEAILNQKSYTPNYSAPSKPVDSN